MKTKRTYILIVLSISLTLFANVISAQTSAVDGIINLKNYDFNNSEIVDLNGIWEFYPNKLYTPQNLSSVASENSIRVSVPALWDHTFFKKSDNFNIGYGTYKLKVLIPDSMELMAIRLKRIESSYTLWINNDTLISCGTTGANKESAKPSQKTLYKIFPVKGNSFDITIQVSNFHHRKGGIDNPISIGSPLHIVNKENSARGFEMFIIGVLLIMAFFHFGLFIAKRKDFSLLFFGLLLITEMISMMTNGEVLFTTYFPDMSWFVLKKIDYISNFLRLIFFSLFFYKLYEKSLSSLYMKILVGLNITLTMFVLFTDLLTYSPTLFVFIVAAGITIIYILFAQINGIIKKEAGALIPFLGTFIFLLTAVNDILFVSNIIETMYLVPAGIFIFIFSQSYILSFNFSNLYKKTEDLNKMTSDMEEIKNNLLEKRSFKFIDYLETLTEFGAGTRGVLFSVSENRPEMKSEFPEPEEIHSTEKYPLNLIKETIEKQNSIIVNNPGTISYYSKKYISDYTLKSSVCIPLKAGKQIRAILYLENTDRKYAFNQHSIDVYEHLSDQIIGVIDNIEMYNELKNLNLNLESIVENRTKDLRNQNSMLEDQKIEIETINNQLNETLQEVSAKNKIVKESINFAKSLQDAVLPDNTLLSKVFIDYFVLNRPKEFISGDFFWINNLDENYLQNPIFAVGDCTGHGVPGTLISIIGGDLLNKVAVNNKIRKPSEILNSLQTEIAAKLANDEQAEIKDGMDIAVISYDKASNILEYAGAGINLIIFRNGKMTEVNADRLTISAVIHERLKDKKFTNHKIHLKKDDIVYLFSDGFQDQFGGPNDSKFMKKNFRDLLQKLNPLAFTIQRSHLLKSLNTWMGKHTQTDDILVVGLKF